MNQLLNKTILKKFLATDLHKYLQMHGKVQKIPALHERGEYTGPHGEVGMRLSLPTKSHGDLDVLCDYPQG